MHLAGLRITSPGITTFGPEIKDLLLRHVSTWHFQPLMAPCPILEMPTFVDDSSAGQTSHDDDITNILKTVDFSVSD